MSRTIAKRWCFTMFFFLSLITLIQHWIVVAIKTIRSTRSNLLNKRWFLKRETGFNACLCTYAVLLLSVILSFIKYNISISLKTDSELLIISCWWHLCKSRFCMEKQNSLCYMIFSLVKLHIFQIKRSLIIDQKCTMVWKRTL